MFIKEIIGTWTHEKLLVWAHKAKISARRPSLKRCAVRVNEEASNLFWQKWNMEKMDLYCILLSNNAAVEDIKKNVLIPLGLPCFGKLKIGNGEYYCPQSKHHSPQTSDASRLLYQDRSNSSHSGNYFLLIWCSLRNRGVLGWYWKRSGCSGFVALEDLIADLFYRCGRFCQAVFLLSASAVDAYDVIRLSRSFWMYLMWQCYSVTPGWK